MTVNFSKDKFNLREKLKELERPSVDKLITKDENGAYIDTIRGNTKLESISSSVSDTAVDVFMYDTSKDSDGGAWRKRTTHTSWYNETLGTATRGTRKEFPSVAVIVAETTKVTIYDGDDPDLPMWMEFDAGEQTANGKMLQFWGTATTGVVSSVTMLNGEMVVGTNNGSSSGIYVGMTAVNFVSDSAYYRRNASNQYIIIGNPISDRNVNQYGGYASTGGLVGGNANDLAITVLPNAPIDPSTGLPIPTIAVATDGGLSIIKDDGTVVNKTRGTNETHSIAFDEDNSLIFSWGTSDNFPRHLSRFEIADWIVSANISFTDNYFSGYNEGLGSGAASTGTAAGGFVTVANSGRHFGIDYGSGGNPDDRLGILHPKNLTNNANQNLSAFITSSYNTGWMHGDVKGAFLSDTDTTNAVGTELITNGTFDSDITGWITNPFNASYPGSVTWDSGTSTIKVSNGYGTSLKCGIQQTLTNLIAGRQYVVTFDVATGTTNGQTIEVAGQDIGYSAVGTYSVYFTPNSSSYGLTFGSNRPGYGIVTYYDNISVKLAEEDRSVNNNGLAVYGTVTMSAVATGAELVAYSGFSASNYLQQPYNSNLNFGTGDFSFMAWIYPTNDNVGGIISRGSNGVYGPYAFNYSATIITLVCSSDWNESNDGGSWGTIIQTASGGAPHNVWSHVVAVKSGTTAYVYINGVLKGTDTSAVNPKVPTSNFIPTMIGVERRPLTGVIGRPFPGSLALVRASASAPSAEQVKKMYEDEKVLFQENAKATLYGSSDAVTALAYDEVTDQLHVGTSSGRSDFQGLRRINNTTTAVTTAISAHDEFIIEQ